MEEVIGVYASTELIANSQGEVANDNYLDWLLAQDKPGRIVVTEDINHFASCLCHLLKLDKEQLETLWQKERLGLGSRKITFFDGRFLGIDQDFPRHFVNIMGIRRYITPHYNPSLDINFAIDKAKKIAKAAFKIQCAFKRIGLPTKRLISPVSAAEGWLNSLDVPSLDNVPDEVNEMAWNSLKGNWLEVFKAGNFSAWDYDLNGAYGSELIDLADPTHGGRWLKGDYRPDAIFGFASGRLTTWQNFHPFILTAKEMESNCTPVGSWQTILTKQEMDLLYEFNLGEFKLEKGYWWMPDEGAKLDYPLRGYIGWLWQKRQQTEGLDKKILREIIAGTWGKLGEVRGNEFGKKFFPVWHATVEANCRVKVARTCLQAGIIPLAVTVDGVTTDRPLPIEDTLELGKWRLSNQGEAVIIGAATMAMTGKESELDFSLSLDWLKEQIANEPEGTTYTMKAFKPITLGKVLAENRLDDLGKIEELTRTVEVKPDTKRLWVKYPTNGRELLSGQYNSAPLSAGIVSEDWRELLK